MDTKTFGPAIPAHGPRPNVGLPATLRSGKVIKSSSSMLNAIDCPVGDFRCIMKILSTGTVETTSVRYLFRSLRPFLFPLRNSKEYSGRTSNLRCVLRFMVCYV